MNEPPTGTLSAALELNDMKLVEPSVVMPVPTLAAADVSAVPVPLPFDVESVIVVVGLWLRCQTPVKLASHVPFMFCVGVVIEASP